VTRNAPAVITDALRAEVLRLGTATLYEASRQECILPVALRPAWPGAQVAGAALPVRTAAGDNLPVKNDPGTVGAPITLGAARVRRGDLVVADRDGIVVLPARGAGEVLAAARARARAEAGYLERLRAGELTTQIYGFSHAAGEH
jgi:regulator of RNase E activity RraA